MKKEAKSQCHEVFEVGTLYRVIVEICYSII